jgi:hypothetical protein
VSAGAIINSTGSVTLADNNATSNTYSGTLADHNAANSSTLSLVEPAVAT